LKWWCARLSRCLQIMKKKKDGRISRCLISPGESNSVLKIPPYTVFTRAETPHHSCDWRCDVLFVHDGQYLLVARSQCKVRCSLSTSLSLHKIVLQGVATSPTTLGAPARPSTDLRLARRCLTQPCREQVRLRRALHAIYAAEHRLSRDPRHELRHRCIRDTAGR